MNQPISTAKKKKKDLGISPDMLMGLNMQSEEESKKMRQLKQQREQEQFHARGDLSFTYIDEDSRTVRRPAVKKFDRKRERPIQKTVHLTIEADNKVNMVKSMLKTMGKKTTFEDLLFDLLDNWLKEHYDEIVAGNLVYPGL